MSKNWRAISAPTDVYRLLDADGQLLYVGVTSWGMARINAHRREQPWWPEVRTYTVERYPNRRTAQIVESRAIAAERPRYNRCAGTYIMDRETALELTPTRVEKYRVRV